MYFVSNILHILHENIILTNSFMTTTLPAMNSRVHCLRLLKSKISAAEATVIMYIPHNLYLNNLTRPKRKRTYLYLCGSAYLHWTYALKYAGMPLCVFWPVFPLGFFGKLRIAHHKNGLAWPFPFLQYLSAMRVTYGNLSWHLAFTHSRVSYVDDCVL